MTADESRGGGHRLLTAADEIRLAKRIERGDIRAKDELIESNMRLVFALARRHGGGGVPFDDLVQEGMVGLIRAAEKFDHRRGLKFSTYAFCWIRRSLADAISGARAIRIPASAGHQIAAIHAAEADLQQIDSRLPSAEAIAERTGLGVHSVRALRGAARVTTSLDEVVGGDGTPLGELIADRGGVDAWQHTDADETRRQVWSMLRLLPERHREILLRRYGLRGDGAQTHAQIGAWLGVGAERIRQLEREGLHRLRELGHGRELAA
jgi:RNA polymerase primary sigma factor